MTENTQNTQILLDTGAALAASRTTGVMMEGDSLPYVVVPSGYTIENLERLLPRPQRVKGTIQFNDLTSFTRYVKTMAQPGTVIFWSTVSSGLRQFTAIIDFHSVDCPGWCEHRVNYVPKSSRQFQFWLGNARKWLSQERFAEIIEENTEDITTPDGASLLEIACELNARKTCDFRSAVNLKNGTVQFSYVEDIEAKRGVLEVPSQFTLVIPVLDEPARYPIQARLRYKIEDARLLFQFDLLKLHVLMDQLNSVLASEIKAGTAIDPHQGTYA